MVIARFFCWEIGLKIPYGKQTIEPCDPRGTTYGATKADLSVLCHDTRFDSLRLVLIAANRAVAHIEPSDIDHHVTDSVLVAAIELVEELVRSHIYAPNNVSLDDAMRLPNNRI